MLVVCWRIWKDVDNIYIYYIVYIYIIYIYSMSCSCWETWNLSWNKFRNKALSSQHITNHCKQTGHWELGNLGSESEVNEQKHISVSILDILWKGHMHSHYIPYKSHVLVMDAMLLSSWRMVLIIIMNGPWHWIEGRTETGISCFLNIPSP